jgi:low affinity Fe/Cu permease
MKLKKGDLGTVHAAAGFGGAKVWATMGFPLFHFSTNISLTTITVVAISSTTVVQSQ